MIITSKYSSPCKLCRKMILPGDQVGWEPGQKGVWCEKCTPTASRGRTPSPKAGNGHAALSNGQPSYFKALLALEECVIDKACTTMTPELAAGWEKVQKLKALALEPGTEQEGRTALKLALIAAIKLAF